MKLDHQLFKISSADFLSGKIMKQTGYKFYTLLRRAMVTQQQTERASLLIQQVVREIINDF